VAWRLGWNGSGSRASGSSLTGSPSIQVNLGPVCLKEALEAVQM
jgi:hypothetical protein